MSLPPVTTAQQDEPQQLPAGSLSSSSNTSSSFCSFDVRIWEEIHLQSLISSSEDDVQLKNSDRRGMKSRCKHAEGFSSFSSSPYTSMSERSSPYRSSKASSAFGYSRNATSSKSQSTPVASPVADKQRYKPEQLPIVKVIQTGSMSFSSDGLVLQPPPNEFSTPKKGTTVEALNTHTLDENASTENSVVVGALSGIAKFSQVAGPETNSSPIPPIKPAGSIPFKWEETPGKPKQSAESSQSKSDILPALQLPPKLLYSSISSSSSGCTSPSGHMSHFKHAINSSPRKSADKLASARSIWSSLVQTGRKSYRENGIRARLIVGEEDSLSSPTSTLIGPNAGFSSQSSSSSLTKDAMCPSPDQLPEVQSSAARASLLASRSMYEPSPYLGSDIPNLAPSMERQAEHPLRRKATDRLKSLLKSCQRWSSFSTHRKRNHEEAEMWAPTLGTYYYSMELERNSSISGQSLLDDNDRCERAENCRNSSKLPPPSEDPALLPRSSMDMYAHEMVSTSEGLACLHAKEDKMVFSATPTRKKKHSINKGCKGKDVKTRRKAGGWVLRKLRKSSKILLAVLLRALATNGRRNTSSKKWKRRRRLSYQHMTSDL